MAKGVAVRLPAPFPGFRYHGSMATSRYNLKRGEQLTQNRKRKNKSGDTVIVYRGGRPYAEVRILPQSPTGQRPIGLGKGSVKLHPSFFDPMPDDFLEYFDTAPEEKSATL